MPRPIVGSTVGQIQDQIGMSVIRESQWRMGKGASSISDLAYFAGRLTGDISRELRYKQLKGQACGRRGAAPRAPLLVAESLAGARPTSVRTMACEEIEF